MVVAIAAVAAIVLASGLLAARLSPSGAGFAGGGSASTAGRDELALHGGPCPRVLPDPVDDQGGHGFGTRRAAASSLDLPVPEQVWICRYQVQEVGRTATGGTRYRWIREVLPRRIDDRRLTEVAGSMAGLTTLDGGERMCSADLGPRYLLVGSVDGDLTGVAVDDFGCDEVRLSNDPFVTAPGDPQDGVTAPGVFAAEGLAATAASWWGTSPVEPGASSQPERLRLTCTDDGPVVDTGTVVATPGGVRIVVEDATSTPRTYLTYDSQGMGGDDVIDQLPSSTVYALPPGEVRLGCAEPPAMEGTTVVVEVVDPHGYWSSTTLDQLGCGWGSIPSWAVASGRADSATEAVDELLAGLANRTGAGSSGLTAEQAPVGYSGAATQTWVVARDGRPYLSALVTREGGSSTAVPDRLCRSQR